MHPPNEFSVAFINIVLNVAKISLQLSGALEVAFIFSIYLKPVLYWCLESGNIIEVKYRYLTI